MESKLKIPVIDLFAGPGGLAEGFSSVLNKDDRIFEIKLSIEKEQNAYKTLLLRSFCRQFPIGKLPKEYYNILKMGDNNRREIAINKLYEIYKKEYDIAKEEACLAELGEEKFPPSFVDAKINNALNKTKNWVLIGGPPCQAYSLAGRSRVGGISTNDKRVYLYKEYLRIIAEHQPAVFVMENVKGLLSAKLSDKANNDVSIFEMILNDLKDPSSVFVESNSKKYNIYSLVESEIKDKRDYLIKSELYGIPQKRHRVILLGIREDLYITPNTLIKSSVNTLESVIGKLPPIRSELGRECIYKELIGQKKKRKYKTVIDDQQTWINYIDKYNKYINENVFLSDVDVNFLENIHVNGIGSEYLDAKNTISSDHPLYKWFVDSKFQGITHHISRSHLVDDLGRYLFSSLFTRISGNFPRLRDYEIHCNELLPDHGNATSGKFEDRFRVQLPNTPATTITCHISKDGHYFIHYDPNQCRSLTVREAARIQTFPDNYLFCGSRTAQYHQVGNAVPPYLAYQIGCIVRDVFLQIID